jgi:DNA polymerase IV
MPAGSSRQKQVFQSIVGYYWYLRLRAYEIDQVDFGRKSFGNTYWHTGRKVEHPLYTTREIYLKALRLLNQSGYAKRVRNLAVSVYDLIPHHSEQLEMFSSRSHAVAEAMDRINDKYCEFVITPALIMGMDDTIIDRIAFGGVKELEELYQ